MGDTTITAEKRPTHPLIKYAKAIETPWLAYSEVHAAWSRRLNLAQEKLSGLRKLHGARDQRVKDQYKVVSDLKRAIDALPKVELGRLDNARHAAMIALANAQSDLGELVEGAQHAIKHLRYVAENMEQDLRLFQKEDGKEQSDSYRADPMQLAYLLQHELLWMVPNARIDDLTQYAHRVANNRTQVQAALAELEAAINEWEAAHPN